MQQHSLLYLKSINVRSFSRQPYRDTIESFPNVATVIFGKSWLNLRLSAALEIRLRALDGNGVLPNDSVPDCIRCPAK
jgi:hypothetical protein